MPTADREPRASLNPDIPIPSAFHWLIKFFFHADDVATDGSKLKTIANLLTAAVFLPDPEPNPYYVGGCWLIRSELRNSEGYGILAITDIAGFSTARSASRASYVLAHGDIPRETPDGERLEIHHRCPNRCCFRPSHLQVTTQSDNLKFARTGKQPRQFHGCGRPYNTFYFAPDGKVTRRCSACRRAQKRKERTSQLWKLHSMHAVAKTVFRLTRGQRWLQPINKRVL